MKNRNRGLKLTLLLISSLTILSVITISPALPDMTREFADIAYVDLKVKLVLTLPALMIAFIAPVTGRLIDRHGRLRLLWFSLLLYAASGVSGYFLHDLYAILFSRAVLGIAVGVSMTIVMTLIADYFDGLERQKFVGLQVAFMSLGGILFISVGGIMADLGWRFPFLLYSLSLVALPLSIAFLHEPPIPKKRSENLPLVMTPPILWMLFSNTMLMWIIFFLIPVQIPFRLRELGIESGLLTGAAIAISTAFSALSAFAYSRIKNRLSFLSVFGTGYLLMAAGYICIAVSENFGWISVAMMFSGLGMGMMIPNTNMWVMKITPPAVRGKEIGKLTTFWFLGQFISPIILYPILTVLTLPSTFMLAAGVLLFISVVFMVLHYTRVVNPAIE